MDILKLLILFSVSNLTALSQTVIKCADFQPIKEGKFNEILLGRWNVIRFYSSPAIDDRKKISCVCSIGSSSTDKDKEILIDIKMMRDDGEVQNTAMKALLINEGVLDINDTKIVEHAGVEMKVLIHMTHTLLAFDGDYMLVATCNENSSKKNEYFQTAAILSKRKTASSSFIEKSEKILENYSIPINFNEISHDDCPY